MHVLTDACMQALDWIGQAFSLIRKLPLPSPAHPKGGRIKVTVTIEQD